MVTLGAFVYLPNHSKFVKNRNSLIFETLDFGCNCIFWQTKSFETYNYEEVCENTISCLYDPFRLRRRQKCCTPLKFDHFEILSIFDIFGFMRKLTIGPNDLGGTRESLSRLDLSIPRLDMAPTHAGNRKFCVKNGDFHYFEENSHI